MSALETYLPVVQLAAFLLAWCAAMLTGLLFVKVTD